MRIVVGNHNLARPGGTETYTLTIATHLQRLGHEVWIHADEQGELTEQAREDGLRVPERASLLPDEVDAVIANDAIVMLALAERYPAAPMVMVGHSDVYDLSLPPQLPDLLAGVVVLYDRVERRVRGLDLAVPIIRLQQPVDLEVFKPLRPLRTRAEVVLALGNYVHGERLEMIQRACDRAGLELRQIGSQAPTAFTLTPVERLNEADIVLGKARVMVEAMACGRAAYVLDHNGGDGWITPSTYTVHAADNFAGQSTDLIVDEDRLAADLGAYDPSMGTANRDLAVLHHAATHHAAALVEFVSGLAPRRAPVPAPLAEMARLTRNSWHHEARAVVLSIQLQRAEARAQALAEAHTQTAASLEAAQGEAAQLVAQLAATRAQAEQAVIERDADAARVRHAEAAAEQARQDAEVCRADAAAAWAAADETGGALAAFQRTRRYRLAQLLSAPLDLLRRRRHAA